MDFKSKMFTVQSTDSYILLVHTGTAYAWLASHMNFLQSEDGHGFTYEECTIVATMLHIGRLSSPIINLLFTGKLGRKPALVLASVLMAVASLMQTVCTSLSAVYIASLFLPLLKMSVVASFFRQTLVLIPVYLGSFFTGMGYSWLASYMLFFQSTENGSTPYTIQQCTLMALVLHIGRITATFINILVLGKLGRKTPLIIANSLFLISAGMVLVNRAYLTVAISRLINGIAIGIQDCFSTMYWGEIPSKNFRGMICSSSIAIFYIGILAQYALGTYLSYDDGAIVRTTLAILLVLSTYYMVESPYYLKNVNPDEALKTISWLRAIKLKQAEKELEEIDANETNIREFFEDFKKPETRKSFGIILSLGFISTSMAVLSNSFANFIIPQTEFLNSHQFAILLNIIPITMSVLSAGTIDRFGKRLWLLVGFSIGIFLNALIASIYYLEEKSILKIANFSWIVFFIIALFLIVYFLSIGPTIIALRTELFPTSHKVFGISLAVIFNAISFSLGTVFFLRVVKIYGMYLNFLMYCVSCLIGLWLVHSYLPETKGKSLAEIQQVLKNNQKTGS